MLHLDGSKYEGGGQILRTALFLSFITGKSFRIYNIRKNRPQPGLKRQHVKILEALRMMSDCYIEGLEPGSTELVFRPGKIKGGQYEVDIGTAGSITLYLQTIYPVSSLADGKVILKVKGGTDVPWSMTADYWRYVYLYFLRCIVKRVDFRIIRRGYYPRGGGEIKLTVIPGNKKVPPIILRERGDFKGIKIIASSALQLKKRKVAERLVDGVLKILKKFSPEIQVSYENSYQPGCSLLIIASYKNTILGADGIGKLGVPAEKIGEETALKLLKYMNSGEIVDEHMMDNLIPFIRLGGGGLKVKTPTSHYKANLWVTERFVGK